MTAPAIALARIAGGDLPVPAHDPEAVRRLADEILADGKFQPPDKGWLERLVEWLAELIGELFGGVFGGLGGAGSGGSTVLTLLVLAVAAAVVVWLVRHWRPRRRVAGEGAALTLDLDRHRSVREWEAAAARAEAAGDWKEGLRCRFGALVGRLVDDGRLPDVPGRTAGEFRADVHETVPTGADDFAAAADLFERAWYGDRPTGPSEAERFAAHAARVLDAARAAARPLATSGAER